MDFIERLWGISPDGGSGALEFLLLLVPLAIGVSMRRVYRMTRGPRVG